MAEPPSSFIQPRGLTKIAVAEIATSGKAATHLLSCTNCRKRKVKCSKTTPCSACDRSSLTCVFPNRARLPRGRTGGSKTTNVELLRRVNKLEELLDKASGEANVDSSKPSAPLSQGRRSNSVQPVDLSPSEASDDLFPSATVRDEALDRYIGRNFWRSLTYEVGGLYFYSCVHYASSWLIACGRLTAFATL